MSIFAPWRESESRQPHRLSESQLKAFLGATTEERFADLIRFVALTGVRLREALALRWDDVDLESGTAVIRRPVRLRRKDMPTLRLAFRSIDLPAPLVAPLARRRAHTPAAALVFQDERTGNLPGARLLYDAFRRVARRAGLPTVNPRVLRRTWASLLLDAGISASYVSRSLGHASTAVTAAARTPRRSTPLAAGERRDQSRRSGARGPQPGPLAAL